MPDASGDAVVPLHEPTGGGTRTRLTPGLTATVVTATEQLDNAPNAAGQPELTHGSIQTAPCLFAPITLRLMRDPA
ncbi:hypothetical protein [Streptomyces sp. NPDC002889]|uniref:hypothetical protein n=1 Tax=Streptomyces sp. NPDC002889 TaxID=3364669 RepID=UPI0036A9CD15